MPGLPEQQEEKVGGAWQSGNPGLLVKLILNLKTLKPAAPPAFVLWEAEGSWSRRGHHRGHHHGHRHPSPQLPSVQKGAFPGQGPTPKRQQSRALGFETGKSPGSGTA